MDQPPRPSALQEFPVVVELPIQWSDLDAYGHVNNLAYLRWFEAARSTYATRVGVRVLPQDAGVGAVLASVSCRFLRQLSYPGKVLSGVRVTRVSIGAIRLEFRIVDAETGVPVAEGASDAVLWDSAAGEPVPVPDHIRVAIEQLEGKSFAI